MKNKIIPAICLVKGCKNLVFSKGKCLFHSEEMRELNKIKYEINEKVKEYRKELFKKTGYEEKLYLVKPIIKKYNKINRIFLAGGDINANTEIGRKRIKDNNRRKRFGRIQRFRQERELLF